MASVRKWTMFRIAIGQIQMIGALTGLILLIAGGNTGVVVVVAGATLFATAVSVVVFRVLRLGSTPVPIDHCEEP